MFRLKRLKSISLKEDDDGSQKKNGTSLEYKKKEDKRKKNGKIEHEKNSMARENELFKR